MAIREVDLRRMREMDLIFKASTRTRSRLPACFVACLIFFHLANVSAQQPDRIYTVAERFASVLRPDGVAVGAMRLYPRVGVGALYSDNVFATDNFEESDLALMTLAEAVLQSDTSRYFAELGVRANLARFGDFDANDYDNGQLWLAAEKDITGTSNVSLDLDYAHLTEPRTSVNTPADSLELTQYNRSTIAGLYNYQPSRWKMRLDGRYRILDFEDVATLQGTVNNDDRNRKVFDFGIRLGYDFADTYGLFLEARKSNVDYDQRVDDNGFERSFDGSEVRFGTELMLSGLVTGELFLGYLSRDFNDSRFARAQGPSFGAEIDWVITGITTLNIHGSRSTDPTTVNGASTITNSRYSLGIDHELRRNLMLQLEIEVANEDFEGIDRQDDIVRAEFSAEYRMNRNLWLTVAYRYWDRDSGLTGRNFTINEATLDVTFQM